MIAKINEIFKSKQGEGLWQGKLQVFLRFFGCNLNCQFCDTKQDSYQLMNVNEVLDSIASFHKFHSVSLTGGEPLLQIDFLRELAQCLKRRGQITYLETNGILYQNLAKVIENIDIIAMDFKFPSSTGIGPLWAEHQKFMEIARNANLFIKTVIGQNTTIDDLDKAIRIIKTNRPDVSLILQPENSKEELLPDKLTTFKKRCTESSISVKIISQLQKKLGIR